MAEFFTEVRNVDLVAAYRGMPETHAEMERLVPRVGERLAAGSRASLEKLVPEMVASDSGLPNASVSPLGFPTVGSPQPGTFLRVVR